MKLCFHTMAFSSYPIWVNSYLLDKVTEILAEIGYPGIEILAERPHALPNDLGSSERQALRKKLQGRGLQICAVCPLVAPHRNPASPFSLERKDSRRYLEECVRLAADLECNTVVFPAGWSVIGVDPQECYKYSCETLSHVSLTAEKMGVQLAVEAVWHRASNIVYTSSQAIEMARAVGSPAVKLMIDTFHVCAENELIPDVVRAYGDETIHVHLADIAENRRERRIPGEGIVNIMEALSALQDSGYDGAVSIELWGTDPVEIARDSYRYLMSLPGDFFGKRLS